MIYRCYFDPDALGGFWDEHRYGRWLLAYALFREKKLKLSEGAVTQNVWGKPCLRDFPNIEFNISHCNGLVGCVVSDVPVGIDVEKIRPFSWHAARHACSTAELNDIEQSENPDRLFFIYWALKESCVKAMGTGLSYPLKDIVFQIEDQRIVCRTHPRYQFLLLEHHRQFVTSVCYRRSGRSVRILE